MSAARKQPPAPDMSGVSGDWKRLQELRRGSDKPEGRTVDEHDQEQPDEPGKGQQTTRRQSPAGRTRGGRRPPPAAADAIPTTIRFDTEESSEIDRFVLELREDAGRRALDKAEVFRELIRLAREHEPTKKSLLRRLR
ncbi:hypothetical protein [Bacillus mycoides]